MTQQPNPAPKKALPVAKPLTASSGSAVRRAAATPVPALPPLPVRPSAPQQAGLPIMVQATSHAKPGTRRAAKKGPPVPLIAAIACGVLLLGMVGGLAAWAISSSGKPPKKQLAKVKKEQAPAIVETPSQPTPAVSTFPATPPAGSSAAGAPATTRPTVAGNNDSESSFQFKPQIVTDDPQPTPQVSAVPVRPIPVTTIPNSAPPAGALPPISSAPSSGPMFPTPAPVAGSFEPAGLKEDEQLLQTVADLYAAQKLLVKKEYPTLRKLFAERFAREHAGEIQQGLGPDHEAMQQWLSEHPEVREELFTAIRPGFDKIPAVFTIFNELRKQFPDKMAPYANLAIATAIAWDDPASGIYDYGHHAQRCKANMPAALLDAIENFKYFVAAESVMQGRIQHVPWEFLVHVVNHRTPEPERVWAVQNFVGKRVMYGKCYTDVPYDMEMLRTQSAFAKLNGKDYTLPNILTFGGVCAMQADFASRVGKSMGVSAEYVRGESAGGDHHAWVMWVELKQATPTGLVFSLESHGRYRGDKYYVGTLRDPHTGQPITDRDMELRLQTVGLDTVAKRHAALVMAAYPGLCEKAQLDTTKKLALLNQTITYSPGCEEAWQATARLFREVSGERQHAKQYGTVLDRLFTTFTRVPDFTWKVFDDLAAYQSEPKPRVAMYQRLVTLYESADRPDLACEARLKLTDLLVEQDKGLEAIEGLAMTIKKFPGEGRYVPKMLDRIELLCAGLKNADQQLVQFYAEVLPLVPQMRGSDPSPFALQMFERGVGVFTRCHQPQLAQAAQAELEKIRSGNGRKGT